MNTVCCVYDEKFWYLRNRHKLKGGKVLVESGDQSLCASLYKVRRQQDFEISIFNVFSARDTKAFGSLLKKI